MIHRLKAVEFAATVTRADVYSFVVFSSNDCPPCTSLLTKLNSPAFSRHNVEYFEFKKADLDATEIVRGLAVGFLPRSVIFRDGQVVGRLLFDKPANVLQGYLDELIDTGQILSDPSDVEEFSRFVDRVKEALNWDFRRDFPRDEWQDRANQLMDTAQAIADTRRDWPLLTTEEIAHLTTQ